MALANHLRFGFEARFALALRAFAVVGGVEQPFVERVVHGFGRARDRRDDEQDAAFDALDAGDGVAKGFDECLARPIASGLGSCIRINISKERNIRPDRERDRAKGVVVDRCKFSGEEFAKSDECATGVGGAATKASASRYALAKFQRDRQLCTCGGFERAVGTHGEVFVNGPIHGFGARSIVGEGDVVCALAAFGKASDVEIVVESDGDHPRSNWVVAADVFVVVQRACRRGWADREHEVELGVASARARVGRRRGIGDEVIDRLGHGQVYEEDRLEVSSESRRSA